MKYLKIIAIVLAVGILIYFPVSFFLSTAQAAEDPANAEQESQNEQVLPLPAELYDFNTGLAPTVYTPDTYVQPQYDPFNNKYQPYHDFEEKVKEIIEDDNTPPEAKFLIRTKQTGIADLKSGTTETKFIFDAHPSSDNETKSSILQVRWDFESDGTLDTYYSRNKTTSHVFEEPGVYAVTLEVLDQGGMISRTINEVIVVTNTDPFAYFEYSPQTGTENQIFTFNTSDSDDSQYKNNFLEYRWDWDGDGNWDTPYNKKSIWRHKFNEPGDYHIVMEAKDPEGAASYTHADISVTKNTAPTAKFNVDVVEVKDYMGVYKNKYYFDASVSTDSESPDDLKYRWDFNYTGKNDINFSRGWSTSSKYSGMYDFPGNKVVRLQVMDEDGEVSETFQEFTL